MRTIRIGSPLDIYLRYRMDQLTEELDRKLKNNNLPSDTEEELRIAHRERVDELCRLQELLRHKTIVEGRK